MNRLFQFPLDQGGTVLIEVSEPSAGPTMRGTEKDRSALVEKADRALEDATVTVTPAVSSLLARLRSIEEPPEEVGIEFGVQLSAHTGAFSAFVATEAKVRVTMTWRRRGPET
jgi:hypothetical protein